MAPGRSQAQKAHLAAITANRLAASTESDPVKILELKLQLVQDELSSTKTELSSTKTELSSTKNRLSSAEIQLSVVETQLSTTETQLSSATDQLYAERDKFKAFYGGVRVERRKYQRTVARKGQLESQIKILQSAGKVFQEDAAKAVTLLDSVKSENTLLQQQLSTLMEKCAVEA